MSLSSSSLSYRNFRSASLAIALALAAPVGVHAVEQGKQAPDFELPSTGQNNIKLSNYKGKVVYLDFWASWCGPCKKTFPWMNEMQKKYGKDGFQIVAINVDKQKVDADKFLATAPAEFTILLDPDGNVAKTFDLQGMPSSFIIDRNGTVRIAHRGFKDGNAEELEGEIKKLVTVK